MPSLRAPIPRARKFPNLFTSLKRRGITFYRTQRRNMSSSSLAPSAGFFPKFSKRSYSVSDLAETPLFPAIFSAGLNLLLLFAIVLLLDWSTYILLDSNPLVLGLKAITVIKL